MEHIFKDIITYIFPIVAIYYSVNLYKSSNKIRKEFEKKINKKIQLLYMSKLAYGTILISLAYLMASARWTLVGNYDKIPDMDSLLWSVIEIGYFIFLIKLNHEGREIVEKNLEHKELKEKNRLIENMIKAAGGYVWQKDEENKYIFCDPSFKKFFYYLDEDIDITGKTDIELVQDFKERTGLRHTFGELCCSTDDHCKQKGKKCRYIECGYIGNQLVILDVIKTPIPNQKGGVETVGFAWDRSKECKNIFRDICEWLEKGLIQILDDGVYYIENIEDKDILDAEKDLFFSFPTKKDDKVIYCPPSCNTATTNNDQQNQQKKNDKDNNEI